jgi:hypothetical protein
MTTSGERDIDVALVEARGDDEHGERTVRIERGPSGPVVVDDEPRHGQAGDGVARPPCAHCRGTGRALTKNDLLREMLAVAGLRPVEDVKQADGFVVEFYRRFLESDAGKPWADKLGPVFPEDLVAAGVDEEASAGRLQREKLLAGLVRALADYDPDLWERSPQVRERYDEFLRAAGRSHTGFVRRSDGTVRGPAKPEEYDEVEQILGAMCVTGLGERWRPEYGPVLHEAYVYAKVEMLWAQQHPEQGR